MEEWLVLNLLTQAPQHRFIQDVRNETNVVRPISLPQLGYCVISLRIPGISTQSIDSARIARPRIISWDFAIGGARSTSREILQLCVESHF